MLQNTGMETCDSDIPSNINNAERTTPFEIHKLPEEDFGKVYHRGSVNFQMHLPSVRFLDKVYHRGSKYSI